MKNKLYKENAVDFDKAFFELYSECQDTCFWFWKKSLVPDSIDDKKEALRQIEKSGSLAQFVRARELSKWL